MHLILIRFNVKLRKKDAFFQWAEIKIMQIYSIRKMFLLIVDLCSINLFLILKAGPMGFEEFEAALCNTQRIRLIGIFEKVRV